MDHKRYQAIEAIISGIHDQFDKFRSSKYTCPSKNAVSLQCGSMLLGALAKGVDSVNMLLPRPEVPFSGYNFEELCNQLRGVQTPLWYDGPCTYINDYNYNYGRQHTQHTPQQQHGCTLTETVNSIITAAEIHIKGLSLDEGDM